MDYSFYNKSEENTKKRKDNVKSIAETTAKPSASAPKNATVSLSDFVENPDNPSVATDDDIARLAGKLRRVPLGLTAMRIAYVTDRTDPPCAGKRTVISGNKRLRVLKQAYGESARVPADWFADVTAMSEAERHEFIVSANVSDGEWDVDRLLAQYERSELADLLPPADLDRLLADVAAPKEQHLAENQELDADSFEDIIEFKVSLSSSQYEQVVAHLRTVNDDLALALVEVCNG